MEGKYLTFDEYSRIRSFVNTLDGLCKNCNRRNDCENCYLNNVDSVLATLDNARGERPAAERAKVSAFRQRMVKILKDIRERGACRGMDIDTEGNGTRQNKYSCLMMLCRRGILRIVKDELGFSAYQIVPEKIATADSIIASCQ